MVQQGRAFRTRKAILEAAGSVFNEFGYEAATIGEILARAKVTTGALYFHFSSKEDLARGVLEEAVTLEGVSRQPLKLQELVDAALLLAHRIQREPMLAAANRLALDVSTRALFGTRWPEWMTVVVELLNAAKERGETLPHIEAVQTARILVGAWTGIQQMAEAAPGERDLTYEISVLLELMLPSIAVPAILVKLDFSAERPLRLLADNGT